MEKELAERIAGNKAISSAEYEKYSTSPVTDAVIKAVDQIRAIEKQVSWEAACHPVEKPQDNGTILEMVHDVIRETSIKIVHDAKVGLNVSEEVTAFAALIQAVGLIPGVQ